MPDLTDEQIQEMIEEFTQAREAFIHAFEEMVNEFERVIPVILDTLVALANEYEKLERD